MPNTNALIRVAIAGASGKMGSAALLALASNPKFDVCAILQRGQAQTGSIAHQGIMTYTKAEELLVGAQPDVWLDFTDINSVVRHIDLVIEHGVRPVIGATGYGLDDVARWHEACQAQGIGGIAVPNFAIGALLMMRFAAEAAQFFPSSEIIELHHDGKKDAPSGTAKRTAERMTLARENASTTMHQISGSESQTVNPSRGLRLDDVHIHSIRLPGLVAHQEVIFGGMGETLTIRHDSLSRESFMPGVQLACEKVGQVNGMVYGLEQLLW